MLQFRGQESVGVPLRSVRTLAAPASEHGVGQKAVARRVERELRVGGHPHFSQQPCAVGGHGLGGNAQRVGEFLDVLDGVPLPHQQLDTSSPAGIKLHSRGNATQDNAASPRFTLTTLRTTRLCLARYMWM